jgi:hypothetical protein
VVDTIVALLVQGSKKKGRKIPRKELNVAEKRRQEHLAERKKDE